MKRPLQLSFKGDRTYLQGGDFFNELERVAIGFTSCGNSFVNQLAFRRLARKACDVSSAAPSDQSKVVGNATLRASDGGEVGLWIVETDQPVTTRRPYDEDRVFNCASINHSEQTVILDNGCIYTPIEDIIALTKLLNYTITPKVEGKWLFGQISLSEPLTKGYSQLKVRVSQLIAARFSINNILIDGRNVGAIRFIVGTS